MRNGILTVGAATVSTLEQSSGIDGFFDGSDSKTFRPTPNFLDPALAGTEPWCAAFIDYWNGAGAFARMTPAQRASVIAVSGKIFAELHDIALGADTFADWHRAMPMTIAYGSRTPHAAQAIARALAGVNPHAVLDRVVEAGHMAPLTEPARVSPGVEAHFRRVGIT